MFRGLRKSDSISAIDGESHLHKLLREDRLIIFKYSSSCPVSWAAKEQVIRFLEANPAVPVYEASVQQQPTLMRMIEQCTGVIHESPQIIALRRGKVISVADHWDICSALLSRFVNEPAWYRDLT